MSDSTAPPAALPPIPEGCGILPIAENVLHPGAHTAPHSADSQGVSEQPDAGLAPDLHSVKAGKFGAGGLRYSDPMEFHYRRVLARALALCSGALLVTALVSASVASNRNVMAGQVAARAIFVTQLLFLAFCGRFVEKLGMVAAGVLLFGYAVFCGLEFASLVSPSALAVAFLCAALLYGATALWSYARGCDLARPVTPIFMILAGGLILAAVNLALGTPRFAWTLSSVAVVIFAALEGSHAQRIRDFYQDFDDDNAEGWKASLVGALLLLLNSVNLYLLVASLTTRAAATAVDDAEGKSGDDLAG